MEMSARACPRNQARRIVFRSFHLPHISLKMWAVPASRPWLSWKARLPSKQRVGGSNPSGRATSKICPFIRLRYFCRINLLNIL
jgi:hypothetical protein